MLLPEPRRIALFVPSYAWGLSAGIANFAAPPMLWDTISFDRSAAGFQAARKWRPDGVIGMLGREDFIERAREIRAPIVNVHGGREWDGIAQVGCDHQAIGKMAAAHLLSLGFSQLACIGFPGQRPGEDRRIEGFISAAKGARVDVFDPARSGGALPEIRGTLVHPDDLPLHAWIHSLPKSSAVFASGDMMAARVIRACRHLDIPVPERLAVVGVGDLPEFCLSEPVSLSSVALPWEQLGYQAAALLHRILQGGDIPGKAILMHPSGITIRRSSDILAVPDQRIADVLRFIRAHACEKISVPDILRKLPMGRRVLERKFREILDRTPHEEIIRVRLERVSHYLINTEDTIKSISSDCGFGSVSRMSVDFKKHFGTSPGRYRNQFGKIRPS